MPTSATGKASRPGERGFTLVELMVVVTLIGLMSTLVVLSLPDSRPTLSGETDRFAARLLRAREEAVITGQTVEVTVAPEGYSFARRRGGERLPLVETPFGPVAWEAETRVSGPETEPLRVVFDSTGASEPAELLLQRDDRTMRVSVDAAGEVRVDAPNR